MEKTDKEKSLRKEIGNAWKGQSNYNFKQNGWARHLESNTDHSKERLQPEGGHPACVG